MLCSFRGEVLLDCDGSFVDGRFGKRNQKVQKSVTYLFTIAFV